MNALFEAIRNQNIDQVRSVLESNPEFLKTTDQRGSTPLILATYVNLFDITKALIEAGADVNQQDASGNTALMGVCFKGNIQIAELLVSKGAHLDTINSNGATALIYATTFAQPEVVKLFDKAESFV